MVLGVFNNFKFYPGIVLAAGHDAASKSYAVMFEDGEVHPRFRGCDVKQDMECPVEGDAIAVRPPGSYKKADEQIMTFVKRSIDGAVELRMPGATVVLSTAAELKTLKRLVKAPVVPKVRLRSIPSWAETVAAMPSTASSTLKPAMLVTLSKTATDKWGTRRTTTKTVEARNVVPRLNAMPAVGAKVS